MGLYIRSSMPANEKGLRSYGCLRDTRSSHCCSPLCNNFTLLLSQAIWSLRLGSTIKETSKMNVVHFCPCVCERQKTERPQRNVPLLS